MKTEETSNLVLLFQENPLIAIQYCKQRMSYPKFDCYSDYYSTHNNPKHLSTCQNSWNTPMVAIHCDDCKLTDSSCICLDCFLKGNHEGHTITIRPESIGNCDCGDTCFWKLSGCCRDHQGQSENPDLDQLDLETREMASSVFSASFKAINVLADGNEGYKAKMIFDFLGECIKLGDGFRRVLAISIIDLPEFAEFIDGLFVHSQEINDMYADFVGTLINDKKFSLGFSLIIYKKIPWIMDEIEKGAKNGMIKPSIKKFFVFLFHIFAHSTFIYHFERGFDWVKPWKYTYEKVFTIYQSFKNEVEIMKSNTPSFVFEMMSVIPNLLNHPNGYSSLANFLESLIEILPKFEGKSYSQFNIINEPLESIIDFYCSIIFDELIFSFEKIKRFDLKPLIVLTNLQFSQLNDLFEISSEFKMPSLIEGAKIATFTPLTKTLASLLCFIEHYNIKEYLIDSLNSINVNPDIWSIHYSIIPIRLMCSFYLNSLSLIPAGSRSLILFIQQFSRPITAYKFIAPFFAAIQIAASINGDKKMFVSLIWQTLGLASVNEHLTSCVFVFLVIISSIVYDRSVISHDQKSFYDDLFRSYMREKPLTMDNIDTIFRRSFADNNHLQHTLSQHAIIDKVGDQKRFVLKDKSNWNPISPAIVCSNVLQLASLSSNSIPFPELTPEIRGLDLIGLLYTPWIFAAMYFGFISKHNESSLVSLNLLKDILPRITILPQNDEHIIEASTITELAQKLPSEPWNMLTIKVSFGSNSPQSLAEIVSHFSTEGEALMNKFGLVFDQPIQEPSHDATESKRKQKKEQLLKQIIGQVQGNASIFAQGIDIENNEEEDITCCICSEFKGGQLYYSANIVSLSTPFSFDGINEYVIIPTIFTCRHVYHKTCHSTNKCPIDRHVSDLAMPFIKENFNEISEQSKEILRQFLSLIHLDKSVSVFKNAFLSLCASLTLLDLRLRNDPKTMIYLESRIVIHTLFASLFCLKNDSNFVFVIDEHYPRSYLMIRDIIYSESPVQMFSTIVMKHAASVHGEDLVTLLRRALILQTMLNSPQSSYEFDLSIEKLSHFYDIKNLFSGEIAKFSFPLVFPKQFLFFAKEPTCYPMNNPRNVYYLCLSNGVLYSGNRDNSEKYPSISQLREFSDPLALMAMSGTEASSTVIYYNGHIIHFPTFYVDIYGDEDVGYSRGQYLYLNEQKMAKFIEFLLSGSFLAKIE